MIVDQQLRTLEEDKGNLTKRGPTRDNEGPSIDRQTVLMNPRLVQRRLQ